MNTNRMNFRKDILHKTLDSLEMFHEAELDIMPTVNEFLFTLVAKADAADIELDKTLFSNREKRRELEIKREDFECVLGIFANVFGEKVSEIHKQLKK